MCLKRREGCVERGITSDAFALVESFCVGGVAGDEVDPSFCVGHHHLTDLRYQVRKPGEIFWYIWVSRVGCAWRKGIMANRK